MANCQHILEDEFLCLAMETSLKAARAIMEVYDGSNFDVSIKDDRSPLTQADRRSHEIITDGLALTGLPVLSEEGRAWAYAERVKWARYWLVDPLDGTKEFIRRNGEFTVNLALIDHSYPRMGIVCAPAAGCVYWGCAGEGGAFRSRFTPEVRGHAVISSGITLTAAPHVGKTTSPVRLIASRSHSGQETEAFIAEIESHRGPVQRVPCGSSLKICRVAEGQADIYPRLGPTMEWDTAAAQAVLEAAGGRMVVFEPARSALDYFDLSRTDWKRLRYNKEDLLNPSFVAMR